MTAHLSNGVKKREEEIRMYIEQHSESFGLDPNLIRALITQESRFIADAVSPTGSFGLVHQGITLTKLPTNFDSLKTNDPEKARFQFTVTKPLTPSSSPSCLAS